MKNVCISLLTLLYITTVHASEAVNLRDVAAEVGEFTQLIESVYSKSLAKYFLVSDAIPKEQFSSNDLYDTSFLEESLNHRLGRKVVPEKAYARAAKSTVIMVSDTHGTPEIRDLVLRLLKEALAANSRPKVFVFELIGTQFQSDMNDYMDGKITQEELRLKVNWDNVIGYGWEEYVPLFEFLRVNKVKTLVALRPSEDVNLYDMRIRDPHTVGIVDRELSAQPTAQVFVWQGYYHMIGKNHISDMLFSRYGRKAILFLTGLPHLYWKSVVEGYTTDPSLFVKVKGANHRNTYYAHTVLPTSRSTWILRKISEGVTTDKDLQTRLLAKVDLVETEMTAAGDAVRAKDIPTAQKAMLAAKTSVSQWASLVIGTEDVNGFLPTIKEELARMK